MCEGHGLGGRRMKKNCVDTRQELEVAGAYAC